MTDLSTYSVCNLFQLRIVLMFSTLFNKRSNKNNSLVGDINKMYIWRSICKQKFCRVMTTHFINASEEANNLDHNIQQLLTWWLLQRRPSTWRKVGKELNWRFGTLKFRNSENVTGGFHAVFIIKLKCDFLTAVKKVRKPSHGIRHPLFWRKE